MTRGDWAALATIHRCPACGQWVCAPRFQRVEHTCQTREQRGAA